MASGTNSLRPHSSLGQETYRLARRALERLVEAHKGVALTDKSGMPLRFIPCLFLCACAWPQNQPESSPGKSFQFTGALDAFYSGNLNHPLSGDNQLRNFDTQDGWTLDFASLSVRANGPKFGLRLDTGFGEMYKTMNLADTWGGPNRYISQAYVSYKPIHDSALEIDAGKFFTSAGAEAPESYENFNYSRSLLFVLGEPYYHFGMRSTIPLTKSFSIGAQFLDGCNNLGNLQGGKLLGLVPALTRSKWNWTHTYLVGPERIGARQAVRHFHDSALKFTPRAWVSAYISALHATERWSGGGSNSWYGFAGAAKFSPRTRWSFSPRLGWFRDSTGFNTGLAQQLKEVTLTAEYRPWSHLIARAEYRRDWSDRPFFDRGATPGASKKQDTFLLAWIFVIRRER